VNANRINYRRISTFFLWQAEQRMIIDLDKIYEMFQAESVVVLAALFFGVYSFIMVTSGSIGSAPGFSSSGANDRLGAIIIIDNTNGSCKSSCGVNKCIAGKDANFDNVACSSPTAEQCLCGTHQPN
jgi:hypothetical protein